MQLNLKNILLNNNSLKLLSLFFGFGLWYILSQPQHVHVNITTPVCFYNSATRKIEAPESIDLELVGKRSDIKRLSRKNLALHLDAQQLHEGEQHIIINEQHLFLPASIKLVNCTPSHLIINVKESKEQPHACIT
jgi:hypothetical protein